MAPNTKCQPCLDGSKPSAHKCYWCGNGVHPFEPCSFDIGKEEKYGQQRGCFACIPQGMFFFIINNYNQFLRFCLLP